MKEKLAGFNVIVAVLSGVAAIYFDVLVIGWILGAPVGEPRLAVVGLFLTIALCAWSCANAIALEYGS